MTVLRVSASRTRTVRLALFSALLFAVCAAGGALAPRAHALPSPASGGPVWWWEYRGPSLVIDNYEDCVRCPDGSLVAAGYAEDDGVDSGNIYVAKFTSGGAPVWQKSWNGPDDLTDVGIAVTSDRDSNVIVAGLRGSTAGQQDLVVLKWSSNGAFKWNAVYDGALHHDDAAYDVTTDARGDVVACGIDAEGTNALVIKFRAATGTRAWARLISTTSGGQLAANSLVVDGARNIYVTGRRREPNEKNDAFLVKYSPAGKVVWQRTWDGGAHLDDQGLVVRLAPGPALYVAGTTAGAATGDNALLLKYDLAGHRKWARTWDGAAHGSDYILDLACDARGNALMAGTSASGGPSGDHGLLIKYTAAGRRAWTRTWYNWPTSGFARYYAVVVSGSGRCWVTGVMLADSGRNGMLVTRYSAAGKQDWVRVWEGPAGLGASPQGMVSGGGGLFVCGKLDHGIGNTDAFAGVVMK